MTTTIYEITGNSEVGFYVWTETTLYGGRCQSSSFITDQTGMKKKFNTREEAEKAIQEESK